MSKLLIPPAALDKHTALLGMTGSGKTSVAKSGIVEPDLDAGRRVIVIDPTSAWWGLRLSKSGKSAGYPIYIFGGDHGDYPLRASNAKLLAESFATSSDSAIFDTSQMTVSERTTFFTEFAETFRRKNKGWVRFVIDEAHLFMPQQGAKSGGGVPAMLHAGNNLVSLGRSRGLRIVMISQRAAKLHKDSLTQAHSLIAMQLMSPQDRGAIKDWVEDQADPVKGKEIIASLPSLVPGEAWVWAPQAKFLERVKFPRPGTFDSSSAPDDDDADGPTLAPINLDALKGRLASVEAERKASDPKELRTEIADLKRQLAAKGGGKTVEKIIEKSVVDPRALAAAEKRGIALGEACGKTIGFREALRVFGPPIEELTNAMARAAKNNLATFESQEAAAERRFSEHREPAPPAAKATLLSTPAKRAEASVHASATPRAPIPEVGGDGTYSGPQRKIMGSLAIWKALGHDTPSREQVAFAAGYSPSGSAFTNPLSALKTAGAVDYPQQGSVRMAVEWPEAANGVPAAHFLLARLSGPQRKILEAARQGRASREIIAERSGYSVLGSAFLNPLSSLRTIGLITYPSQGEVDLADWAAEILGAPE